MLFFALALFMAGLFRPFTEVTKLWIFENKVSVYEGLIILMKSREYFLFAILLVFTVIFPFVKILSLLTLSLKGGLSRQRIVQLYGFVSHLGKWSMLDVFVIAILVLLLKIRRRGFHKNSGRFFSFLLFSHVDPTRLALDRPHCPSQPARKLIGAGANALVFGARASSPLRCGQVFGATFGRLWRFSRGSGVNAAPPFCQIRRVLALLLKLMP